ncbi:PhnD/SsuA/transferrin family substrate-binding protein [Ktedonospora formicarum]|uniref:Phosphate ABC transporter substrate-binding protein n=1 Tax=Ktedonospora formicarum TaxID=2778364 RepID=A0A8J3I8K4_9CHLR|nr:PhnD/SsuA/transferrin family substrate-binding protein [Ktedonospora formicarum]GHO49441.1 hypothetical protein KSX_76040 [Ktedonospora formicarum]
MAESTSGAVLRAATYLSPLLYDTYASIARYLEKHLGLTTTLAVGETLDEVTNYDLAFLCGLLYVRLKAEPSSEIELLVAPVLTNERYKRKAVYFSDVVVRDESPYTSLEDLYGTVWAYNETSSYSGYSFVRYNLFERGISPDFFRCALATGSHLQSLSAVSEGRADVTMVDSHVLDVLRLRQPEYVANLRVIDAFGPASIPPLIISTRLAPELRQRVRDTLLTMHLDPLAAQALRAGCIERFVAVDDGSYDDIRRTFSLARV